MKIDNLFNIGQLLYVVDENSIVVVEVRDWSYTYSLKNTIYTLSYLYSKETFDLYETELLSSIACQKDSRESIERWFDNYNSACECLQQRIEKYQKSSEGY